MQQRSVRDLMRVRHGLVVPETATIREVAERLIISDCDLIAVTDHQGKLAGVVCESSIVRVLLTNPAAEMTIQSLIIHHAESVRLDSNITAAQPLFRSCVNTALPVVDSDGVVCGLLMRSDVIRYLLNRQSDNAESNSDALVSSETSLVHSAETRKSSLAFAPPKKRMIHSGDDKNDAASAASGPHFMKADEARRVLWAAEDRL